MSITITNTTGNVDDTKVIDDTTGGEITGLTVIEISPLKKGDTIMARLTFNKVHLKLGSKIATIQSQASGNFE